MRANLASCGSASWRMDGLDARVMSRLAMPTNKGPITSARVPHPTSLRRAAARDVREIAQQPYCADAGGLKSGASGYRAAAVWFALVSRAKRWSIGDLEFGFCLSERPGWVYT